MARFLPSAQVLKNPEPPPEHYRHMGHHWLKYDPKKFGSGDMSSYMVAEWNPVQKCWMHSNTSGTYNGKPLALEGWEWHSHIQYPALDDVS